MDWLAEAMHSRVQTGGKAQRATLRPATSRQVPSSTRSLLRGQSSSTGDVLDTDSILGNQFDNRANRGVSDFDRTHRFVLSYLWDLPRPAFASTSKVGRRLLSDWQVAGIVTAMSGQPFDIVDSAAGSLYFGANSGLSRPSWAPGATRDT